MLCEYRTAGDVFCFHLSNASSVFPPLCKQVIPTLQVVYNNLQQASMTDGTEQPYHGVQALVLTATIDQAGQAQRMCLGLGQALGITSSLVVGHGDISQEAAAFAQNPPHVLVGTPQKLLDLLSQRTVPVDKLSLLVIDEMDQLIARNLSEYVNSLAKLLPPPMSSAASSRERSPAINGPGSGFKPFEQGGAGRSHERQTAIFSCTV
jgi:superfamily II DNA/RNA helicase